jgi:hypothetical protein
LAKDVEATIESARTWLCIASDQVDRAVWLPPERRHEPPPSRENKTKRLPDHCDRAAMGSIGRRDLMREAKDKPRAEACQQAAKLLQLEPGAIMMMACHNFDLDAARNAGYRTCLVRRPDE